MHCEGIVFLPTMYVDSPLHSFVLYRCMKYSLHSVYIRVFEIVSSKKTRILSSTFKSEWVTTWKISHVQKSVSYAQSIVQKLKIPDALFHIWLLRSCVSSLYISVPKSIKSSGIKDIFLQ